MTVLIILAVLLYMAIGGFVCGLNDEYDMIAFYILLWPIFILFITIVAIAEWPYKLGRRIEQYFRYRGWEK